MTIDLHLHSIASDGVLTAEEIIDKAISLKLNAIALTDHDSVEGVEAAVRAGMRKSIEVVPAVELSSGLNSRDIHFLGYFIDHKNKEFKELLTQLRTRRRKRAEEMLDRLRKQNIFIPLGDVLSVAKNASVGRAHVAQVMVKKGYIDTIEEAFEKYIGRNRSCYVEKYFLSPREVIAVIKEIGGLAVLAHPGLSQVDDYIPDFISYGIQGIEVIHGEHTIDQSRRYLQFAKAHNLVPTGGSDFHGLEHSKRGREMGSVKVPNEFLDRMKERKSSQSS